MKHHIPGLHCENQNSEEILEGIFLVRVDRAYYRWHPQRPFYVLRLAVLEPREHHGAALLHSQGALETRLVLEGFWL